MTTSPSTSNPLRAVGGQEVPAGLPDPALLARLANELFAALPGTPETPALNVSPAAAPVAGELPDEADLRDLPTVLADSKPLANSTPPSLAQAGDAPFYFLRAAPPEAAPAAQPLAGAANGGPLPYFLDHVHPTPPRAATLVDVKPRDAGLEFPPDLGITSPTGVPPTSANEVFGLSLYFVSEVNEIRSFSETSAPDSADPQRQSGYGHMSAHPGFDVHAVRRDFPILQERVHGRPLIWLDNAATTQKPQAVIDRLAHFYRHENSNIHRAAHELAARATDAYEAARDKVARFLNAPSRDNIVFVRGTTEGINLVAQSWGRRHISKDDEIVITWLEHHANIVPWQQLCAATGARLRVAPVDDHGQVLLDEYEKLLGPRTRLVAFSQVSNALGTVTPAKAMIDIAHRYGARVLLDGAQAVSHLRTDVQALDCDWYVFSGHKVFGPTGIGAVYGKLDLLNVTPPWQGGGNMIQDVTFERTIYHAAPARFEAGTGNIADAVGLGAALDYVEKIGLENIGRYEHELLVYGTQELSQVPGLRIIGTAPDKAGVLSFVLDGFRSEEVGAALNRDGIAVRSGHHCAQPILRRFGLESTVRPSLAFYNTREEVDALVQAVRRIQGGSHALRR